MNPRPHGRVQGTGHWVADTLAPRTTLALQHLARELHATDGFPTRGETAGRGTSDNTTTEAAAITRGHLEARQAHIHAAIENLVHASEHLARELTAALTTYTADTTKTPRCRDGQIGKDGTIEWGDTTCLDLQTKANLCGNHYMAWYRWRLRNGVDTTRDFEQSA